jgi:hypothetical protein
VGFGASVAGTGVTPIRVTGWVELDRVALGCSGVFGMHVEEAPVATVGGSSQDSNNTEKSIVTSNTEEEKLTGNRVIESANSNEEGSESVQVSTTVPALHRIVQWKLTEDEDMTNLKPKNGKAKVKPLSKCTLYRFEWSDQMFRAALQKMKFV